MVRGNTDFGGLDVLADVKVLNICNTSRGWVLGMGFTVVTTFRDPPSGYLGQPIYPIFTRSQTSCFYFYDSTQCQDFNTVLVRLICNTPHIETASLFRHVGLYV